MRRRWKLDELQLMRRWRNYKLACLSVWLRE